MQLHRLAVHLLNGIYHILNKLRIRGSRWVNANNHLWLLRFLFIGALRPHLLTIGINSIFANLISRHNRRSQKLKQSRRKRLSRCRIANDQCRVIQTTQFLRAMIEAIRAPRHQRHQQTTTHKQRRRILVTFQSLADVFQQREFIRQRLNLSTPLPKPAAHIVISQRHRRRLRFRDLLIRLATVFLNRGEHCLRGQRRHVLLFLFSDTTGSTLHSLGDVLIPLVDDLLYPRLALHDALHQLFVTIEHEQQVCGQFETFFVTIGVVCTRQLGCIASINNTLYIIAAPHYKVRYLLSVHLADIPSPFHSSLMGHSMSLRAMSTVSSAISRELMMQRLRFLVTILWSKLPVKFFIIIRK